MQVSDELLAGLGGALIGSVLSGVFAWWLHRAEQLSARKGELRTAISWLIDQRELFQTHVERIEDPQAREVAGSFLNQRRAVHLEACQILVKQLGRSVTSSELIVLAWELLMDSNFTEAEYYYKRAVKIARFALARAIALRSLGSFYFSTGPLCSPEKGRAKYKEALGALSSHADPYSQYTNGYTCEMWGMSELSNGYYSEATDLFVKAKDTYSALPGLNPLRENALRWLAVRVEQAVAATGGPSLPKGHSQDQTTAPGGPPGSAGPTTLADSLNRAPASPQST